MEGQFARQSMTLSSSFLKHLPETHRSGFVGFQTEVVKGVMLADESLHPPIRVASFNHTAVEPGYVSQRLHEAYEFRNKLRTVDMTKSAAYRLMNGDGTPGLAVDLYGSFAQVQLYSEFWRPMLPELYDGLGKIGIRGAYLKKRLRGKRQPSSHAWGEKPAADATVVYEGGMRFDINLANPHTTGLFLDQRANRQYLAGLLQSFEPTKRTFLNLFAHTCSFSVVAAKKAAAASTNVDISKPFLDWGKQNFTANKLGLKDQEFLSKDVFDSLAKFEQETRRFSVVLLDPPPFVQGGGEGEEFETMSTRKQDNYARLVSSSALVVEEGGYLVAFSNTRQLSDAAWSRELAAGMDGTDAAMEIEETKHNFGLPGDFRVHSQDRFSTYLKGAVLRKVAHDKLSLLAEGGQKKG